MVLCLSKTKNSIESLFIYTIYFEKNKFILFSNQKSLKNEYTIWTNADTSNFISVNSINGLVTLVDLVAFDSTHKPKFFAKLYNINSDTYISIFSNNKKSLSTHFINASWVEREVREAFNIQWKQMRDTRNLLLDYSLTEPVLLKKNPLEFFKEIKTTIDVISTCFSQSVEL